MKYALFALVVVFLGLAGAGLFFEFQLNERRAELTDRSRLHVDYLVKFARTVEKADPDKAAAFEIKKDASPVEAKIVDSPDMENVLDDYKAPLEQANLETYNWDGMKERNQLRVVYVMGEDGKPVMDGGEPLQRGPGTADELLAKLFESAKTQQSRLNSTRAALADLRGKLEGVVTELNKVKGVARQALVDAAEKDEKLKKAEEEKTALEDQVKKVKASVDELNGEITSLKDEVSTAKDETEAAKEETAKQQKLVENLRKMLKDSIQTAGTSVSSSGAAPTALTNGDKGKIVQVDNANMFAIVEFTDAAMKELKGENLANPMPILEFGLKRPGFKGPAGEFVGRLRIRQEVKGKNFVVCDILGAWEQSKAATGDVLFAD